MPETQDDMFDQKAVSWPGGFQYQTEIISVPDEAALIANIRQLEFAPFEFHGFLGKRRVVSFGWRYDFNGGGLTKIGEMPAFLQPLRDAVGSCLGIPSLALEQVLVTEYAPGAAIGWHRDRPVFGDVVGVSLLGPCTFRFRKKSETGWERRSLSVVPRSAYLLRGPSRREWEHSIPAVAKLRYSITFRTLADKSKIAPAPAS